MSEPEISERPLPDPHEFLAAQTAVDHAARAAFQARRMLAASTMEPLMGCGAGVLSAVGTAVLLFDQAPKWAGIVWGLIAEWSFLIWAGWILWSMRRRGKSIAMFAVDRSTANRVRGLRPANFVASTLFVIATMCFWQWAFQRMSTEAIVLVIGISMTAFAGWFVIRFYQLHFAEDLVFASAIGIPWALYLARTPNTAALGVLASLSAVGAVWSLRHRWKRFTQVGQRSEASSEVQAQP